MDQSIMRPVKERTKDYKNWTDAELIEEAQSLHTSIFILECFGSRDCLRYEMVCRLLDERGYTVEETHGITFVKREEDQDENK
jgi:hypothetical protein